MNNDTTAKRAFASLVDAQNALKEIAAEIATREQKRRRIEEEIARHPDSINAYLREIKALPARLVDELVGTGRLTRMESVENNDVETVMDGERVQLSRDEWIGTVELDGKLTDLVAHRWSGDTWRCEKVYREFAESKTDWSSATTSSDVKWAALQELQGKESDALLAAMFLHFVNS